jgi:hypothetical protein
MGKTTCSSTLLIHAPEVTAQLQAPLLRGKPCCPAHKRTQSSTLSPNTHPTTYTLKHQGSQHPCVSRSHGSHCSTRWQKAQASRLGSPSNSTTELSLALELWLPTGSVLLSGQQSHRTAPPEAHVGNQALEHPLPVGSVLLWWQQHYRPKLPAAQAEKKNRPPNFHCLLARFSQAFSSPTEWRSGEACSENKALECLLPAGSVLLSQQQLP